MTIIQKSEIWKDTHYYLQSHTIQKWSPSTMTHGDYEFNFDQSISADWARLILPIVFESFGTPNRVVDLGGGHGHWCVACKELGVREVTCIDHPAMVEQLAIDRSEFVGHRLNESIPPPIQADLALTVEFAEHVPLERSESIVEFLCTSAPVVLFSAALPHQPGLNHINGQWPWFWMAQFKARGFERIDMVRPAIIHDTRLPWWLRQNIYVFVSKKIAGTLDKSGLPTPLLPEDFVAVHKSSLPPIRPDTVTITRASRLLLKAIRNSIRYRLGFEIIP